jgi:hypothetical protein
MSELLSARRRSLKDRAVDHETVIIQRYTRIEIASDRDQIRLVNLSKAESVELDDTQSYNLKAGTGVGLRLSTCVIGYQLIGTNKRPTCSHAPTIAPVGNTFR